MIDRVDGHRPRATAVSGVIASLDEAVSTAFPRLSTEGNTVTDPREGLEGRV